MIPFCLKVYLSGDTLIFIRIFVAISGVILILGKR